MTPHEAKALKDAQRMMDAYGITQAIVALRDVYVRGVEENRIAQEDGVIRRLQILNKAVDSFKYTTAEEVRDYLESYHAVMKRTMEAFHEINMLRLPKTSEEK